MFTYEFKMYHKSTKEQIQVLINIDVEFYFTFINGNYVGSFIVDDSAQLGYSSEDIELQEFLEGITMHFRDETSKHELAEKLMKRYDQNLVSFRFTNDDVLELIVRNDTDLEDFGNNLKDLIYEDVAFASKLSMVISKEREDNTFNFELN